MFDNYLLGKMAFVQAKGTFRTVPKDKNIILNDENENVVQATVMFYMNDENDIILEEKSKLMRDKFVGTMCELISRYTEQYSPENSPIMGHKFEVSFDRYQNQSVSEFLDSISSLHYVEIKILVLGNPHRNSKFEELARKYIETNSETCKFEGQNINKDADLIRSTEGMVEDGHINLLMEGQNDAGKPATYCSDEDTDDQYEAGNYKDNLSSFKEAISDIISAVRAKHSKR